MLEFRSPLFTLAEPGEHGALPTQGVPLRLSEMAPGALVQISGWRDFSESVTPALAALGFSGLGDYRTARMAGLASCFRIAPDKLLLRHSDETSLAAALDRLDPVRAPTLDLSHARWIFEIEGPAVEELLARLAPLDISLAAFPVGSFALTGIHHVAVMLHRMSAERFEIYVPVSWAASLWELICVTARPFGYRVETV